MSASALSALPKRHWEPFSRSLDSIESIYDSPTLAERTCIPQPPHRPYPHPNMADLSFRMSSATRLHDQVPEYGEF